MAKKPAKPKLSDTVKTPAAEPDWQAKLDKATKQRGDIESQMEQLKRANPTGYQNNPQWKSLYQKSSQLQQQRGDIGTHLNTDRENGPGNGPSTGLAPGSGPNPVNNGTGYTVPGLPNGGGSGSTPPAGDAGDGSVGTQPGNSDGTIGIPKGEMGGGGQRPPLQPFQQDQGAATGLLNNIADQSTNGTLNSFNTSANRLRERLDSAGAGQLDQATGRNLSRGFGNSGAQDKAISDTNAGTQNAYASGLNDLSNQFEQNRLKGLDTAASIGGRLLGNEEQRNSLGEQDLSQRRDLEDTDYNKGKDRDLSKYQGDQNNDYNYWKSRGDWGTNLQIADKVQAGENWRGALTGGLNTPTGTQGSQQEFDNGGTTPFPNTPAAPAVPVTPAAPVKTITPGRTVSAPAASAVPGRSARKATRPVRPRLAQTLGR